MKSLKKLLCCSKVKKVEILQRELNEYRNAYARPEGLPSLWVAPGTNLESAVDGAIGWCSHRAESKANPFQDDSDISHETDDDDDDVGARVDEMQQVDGGVNDPATITTRARFTYEVERYPKNAMIIFGVSEDDTGDRREVTARIRTLKDCFQEFKFEVEEHVDLSKEEIDAKLTEFFSRDFSAYGAVCVTMLSTRTEAGLLAARAQRFHESLVLRWLTTDLPPTLQGKPKIYITEAERVGDAAQTGVYTLPVNSYFHDIVGIHIPVVIDDKSHPLEILCSQLGREDHFLEDVYTAVQKAETTFSELQERPIQVVNTLQMELRLARRKIH